MTVAGIRLNCNVNTNHVNTVPACSQLIDFSLPVKPAMFAGTNGSDSFGLRKSNKIRRSSNYLQLRGAWRGPKLQIIKATSVNCLKLLN